jgi:hypothetical protein
MVRDREKELDLTHIGEEANPATHGASIAGVGRRPKKMVSSVKLITLSRPPNLYIQQRGIMRSAGGRLGQMGGN